MPNWFPWSGSHENRAPIPTPVVLSFSDWQATYVCLADEEVVLMTVLLDKLPAAKESGLKDNLERIVGFQLHRNPVTDKHVVCLEYLLAVENDRCKGV